MTSTKATQILRWSILDLNEILLRSLGYFAFLHETILCTLLHIQEDTITMTQLILRSTS